MICFSNKPQQTKGTKIIYSKKQTRPEIRITLEPTFPAFSSRFLWLLPQECQCHAQENLRRRRLSSSSFYFVHSGWNFCGSRRYTGALPDGKQIKVRLASSRRTATGSSRATGLLSFATHWRDRRKSNVETPISRSLLLSCRTRSPQRDTNTTIIPGNSS